MHFHSFPARAITVLAAAFVVGCTTSDSTDIRTSGMRPSMSITSSSTSPGSNVSVILFVGDSITTRIELEGEDKLSVTAGEEVKELGETKILELVSYSAAIATQEPGDEVVIAFSRGEDDEDAPDSRVALTEKVSLTSPAAGGAFSRENDNIVVTWANSAPSEDTVKVETSGECIQGTELSVPANETSVTLAAGSITKREPRENEEQPVPDECELSITVKRSRSGTVDPAFGGGSLTHTYRASTSVTTRP
jgi:hypothetical protein